MKSTTNVEKHFSSAGRALWCLALTSTLLLSGCGRQAYVAGDRTASSDAPGSFLIPAKVDFLLVQDDTGSMSESHAQLAAQMPGFLDGLARKGWDFHFAATTLTSLNRPIDQIAGSRYDANYGNAWIPPYPGADPYAHMIFPQFFRTVAQYTGFVNRSEVNNYLGGFEPGFIGIDDALYNRVQGTSFLRDDAMLVVFMVGNGNDSSYVNLCRRSDGYVVPCEQIQRPACSSLNQYNQDSSGNPIINNNNCSSASLSFNYFKYQLENIKPAAGQAKFFAAVSSNPNYSGGCLGGNARHGARYQQMANALGGRVFDVCQQHIGNVLSALSNDLQATRVQMRTRYLFIEGEPDPTSIVVKKKSGGKTVTLANDPVNGWTYAGYLSDVHTIDFPAPMNLASGWAIELHGSAKLLGEETASVTYRNAGVRGTVSKP